MKTIYKKVSEKFRGQKPILIDSIDVFGGVDVEGYGLPHVTNSSQEITEEEFKKLLGAKDYTPISVFRETFVIELDEERNKIIAKKYLVHKNSSLVKKINKKVFKTNKSYSSLTFDLYTGEFSIYRASTNTKNHKTKPTIRRDVINYQILGLVSDLFDFANINDDEIDDGLNIIAKYLGYKLSVKELCGIYDHKIALGEPFQSESVGQRAKFFVLLNHLNRTGISFGSAINMFEVAINFRNNKKDFFGKTIYDYYAKELEIDDVNFVRNVVIKRDQYNTTVLAKYKQEVNSKPKGLIQATDYMSIDFTVLKFLYHLGFTEFDIISGKLADAVFTKTTSYHEFNNFDSSKKVSANDIIKNARVLKPLFLDSTPPFLPTDKILNFFSLQKRLKVIYKLDLSLELLLSNPTLLTNIEEILMKSTNRTGLYTVCESFLNRLKKYLPEGSKIAMAKSVNRSFAEHTNEDFSCAFINVKHKKSEFMLFVDQDGIRYWDIINKGKIRLNTDYVEISKQKQSELGKGLRKFEHSFQSGKKPIVIRANYAKKYFENLLGDVITRNMYENIINSLVYLDK